MSLFSLAKQNEWACSKKEPKLLQFISSGSRAHNRGLSNPKGSFELAREGRVLERIHGMGRSLTLIS